MRHTRRGWFPVLVLVAWLPACGSPPAPSEEAVTSVLESFYAAIRAGDEAAAMRLIAPDAVFIESGGLETRAEYEANHLPADIEFESQVTGTRGPMQVFFDDDTAWIIVTTDYAGTFNESPVDFVSAQLMVLSRESGEWLIRAVHWSGRRR
jgi:ketosteroid isomerase-like protein